MKMISFIRKIGGTFFSDKRNKIVYKNAFFSFFLRGISILLSFIQIPLFLNAVDKRQYGIILTITSVANFISFFDVGIGNGLRNKLGKAIAENDKTLARKYVSTGYFYISVLFFSFCLVYLAISPFIDWHRILNIKSDEIPLLNKLFAVIIALFSCRFILQLIGVILMADQKSSLNDTMQPVISLLTIVIFFICLKLKVVNFYTILLLTCSTPILVLIGYTFVLFYKKYKWIRPSFRYVQHSLRKDLLGLGFKFFLIQIVSIIIFSTTNILIAQLFNMESVTTYNIAFKYYNISVILFTIIITPLWGAFTNAWYQNDIKWIQDQIKKSVLINVFLLFINICQFFVFPIVGYFWLKQHLIVSPLLVISLIAYNFIYSYNNIFAYFLASIGDVGRQLICALIGGGINIPLTIWMARNTTLGVSSIVFANIISLLPSTVVTTLQTFELIKKKSLQKFHVVNE